MIREVSNSYASYFDKNKTVDRENWAVTLFASKATGLTKHHAKILVETVNEEGEYKKIMIDLVGGGSGMDRAETRHRIEGVSWCVSYFGKIGVVKYNDNPKYCNYSSPIFHSGHSETWIRSAEKVQQMLDLVKEESERDLAHPRPFSLLGRDSKLNSPIKIFRIIDDSLHDAYKKNPAFLIKIFNIATTYKTHLENGTFSEFCRDIHGGTVDSLNRKIRANEYHKWILKGGIPFCILLFPIATLTWREIHRRKHFGELERYLEIIRLGNQAQSSLSLLDESEMEEYNSVKEGNDENEIFLATEKMIEKIFIKVLNGMEEEISLRDSCFTWAREKLEMVDISLSGENPGLIITDTRNFLIGEKSSVSKFVDNANRLAKKLWKEDLSSNSYSTSDSEGV